MYPYDLMQVFKYESDKALQVLENYIAKLSPVQPITDKNYYVIFIQGVSQIIR